jgi:SulP family sulfate permease
LITGEDVSFDRELIVHGVSNLVAGAVGAPHNYMGTSASLMYHQMKGKGKASAAAVAVLTFGIFLVGPRIIAFIPRMIAAVIMLHMGVDFMLQCLLSNSRSLHYIEYGCMVLLGIVVALYGFVVGMGVGKSLIILRAFIHTRIHLWVYNVLMNTS